MPKDSLSTIALHCAKTLPDSISERKELLTALGIIITTDHPAFAIIQAQIAAIGSLENMQALLPLKFTERPTAQTHSGAGDGDGHSQTH